MERLYKLTFFVPLDAKEKVKRAIFSTGAGRIGKYDSCCFETDGIGQFCPRAGSKPYLGEEDKLEKVQESRVELVCSENTIESAIGALKESHPYETPAYDVVKMENY